MMEIGGQMMEIISNVINNDLFIFVCSISGVLGLIVALVVNSKVTKIKHYTDNSKQLKQKNFSGDNNAKIS